MMEALRNGAQTWVAKILLGLVMVVFAILGVSSMDVSATIRGLFKQDLATIGGKPLGSESFRVELNNQLKQISNQTGNNVTLEDAKRLGIDKQVLDRMIAQASIDAQANRMGIDVGEKAIANSIQAQKMFQDSTGKFDLNRFRGLLQQNGLTEGSFLAQERQRLTRTSVSGVAGENLSLPKTLLDALTRYRDETRDARYFTFTVSKADVPAATEADLKKQYEASPAAYTAPEYRSIAVMSVEPKDMASKIQISDQELADGYATYKQDYFEPEKRDIIQVSFPDAAAAEKAKAKLDAGEDIIKLAGELGQKPADITFNGQLKTDFLDEKIAAAAFSTQEGSVSAPVVGSLNTALLKVLKVKPEHQQTFEEVKSILKERMQLAKAAEEIQSVYAAVEDARAQQTKFEDIAAKAGIPLIVVPAVSAAGVDKDGKPISLPAQAELLKAVYNSDVGLDSDAIQSNDGYVWFDVREVVPSAVRPLDQVKAQVEADWAAAQLRDLASKKAKDIVVKAGDTTKLETLATELNGTIKPVTGLKRNSTSEEFDAAATLALFSAKEKALTWSLEGDGVTARIIEVSKVTPPASGATAGAKEVADLARTGLGGDLLEAYLKSAREHAGVTINEELWRQIDGKTPSQ